MGVKVHVINKVEIKPCTCQSLNRFFACVQTDTLSLLFFMKLSDNVNNDEECRSAAKAEKFKASQAFALFRI